MPLRPLGHRVLIQPDAQESETASGLILPQDRYHVPVSGTIVAVGSGPARDVTIRARVISRCMGLIEELAQMGIRDPQDYLAALSSYKQRCERFESPITVGDRVVYPVEAGLAITEDGIAYILMNEDEIAVIAEDVKEAA